jgi:hypothetical protein
MFAVSDSAVLFSLGEHAGAGRIDRFHERNEDAATVIDSMGAHPLIWFNVSGLGTVPDRGILFKATAQTFDDDTYYFIDEVLYEAGDTPDREEIQNILEEKGQALRSSAADIEIDGQRVRVELRVTPSELGDGHRADRRRVRSVDSHGDE